MPDKREEVEMTAVELMFRDVFPDVKFVEVECIAPSAEDSSHAGTDAIKNAPTAGRK